MAVVLSNFPQYPDLGYEELDGNGEWKDSSIGYLTTEDEMSGKYRRKPVPNEMLRKFAHEVIDYLADAVEAGELSATNEKRALMIFAKDNKLTFGIGELK